MTKDPKLIVLMGARSSGKTSIVDFAFKKLNPTNSLYNASTRKATATAFSALVDFELWDLPGGQFDPGASDLPISRISSIIYVLDAQAYSSDTADIEHKIAYSCATIHSQNARIKFDIFLHKTDSLSQEYRADLLESARQRLYDEIEDLPHDLLGASGDSKPLRELIGFHLTSVFDHTVYEALSKIVQRQLPSQAALEQLLDLLIMTQNSGMDKAFVFHMPTKLYIATDSSPVDQSTHEMLSDFIDLCVDFGALYEPARAASEQQSCQLSPTRNSKPATPKMMLADADARGLTSRRSRVNLANGVSLGHWQIDSRFSLIALLQPHILDRQNALIEYNVSHFRRSLLKIRELEAAR